MKRNDNPNYEERVVLWLDILGWKALVKQSEGDPGLVASIVCELGGPARTAQEARKLQEQNKEVPARPQVTQCSDALVVSCRNEPQGIQFVFDYAKRYSHCFLKMGWASRGAIVLGKLFHRDTMLFGCALLEAQEMEKLADVPRILVSDALLDICDRDLKNCVREDSDG